MVNSGKDASQSNSDLPPKQPDPVKEAFARRIAEIKRSIPAVKAAEQGARFEFKNVLEMSTRIANDDRIQGIDGQYGRTAYVMAQRHNEHLISEDFARHCIAIHETNSQESREWLEELRLNAKREGFFIMNYSPERLQARLTFRYSNKDDDTQTPVYVVSESGGRHPDNQHQFGKQKLWLADCQIYLPTPSHTVADKPSEKKRQHEEGIVKDMIDRRSAFEFPGSNDELRSGFGDWLDLVKRDSYCVANIDDITTQKGMSGLGLASAAMSNGLQYVTEYVNPLRGKYPIKYITAEIASLQGLVLPDGKEVYLGNDFGVAPIPNGRSLDLFDHYKSDVCTHFETVFIRKNIHPVTLKDGREVGLIVNWYLKMARMK